MTATPRHRVVVVGGGFGGMPATRLLASSDVDVTLSIGGTTICPAVALPGGTGSCRPARCACCARLRRKKNVRVVLSQVTGFDLERRVVHTAALPGELAEYAYDSLIVAAGAGQSNLGHDEFAMIAPGMKTIDDAMELRRQRLWRTRIAET